MRLLIDSVASGLSVVILAFGLTGMFVKYRLSTLEDYVRTVARGMGEEMPTVRIDLIGETSAFVEPVQIGLIGQKTFPRLVPPYRYGIVASPIFLALADDSILEFVAAHEMCHAKLRHLLTTQAKGTEETEANTCACKYLKLERCVDAVMSFAEGFNFQYLRGRGREYVTRYVEKYFGMTVGTVSTK